MNERENENIIQVLQHKWKQSHSACSRFIRLCVTDFFVFNCNKIFFIRCGFVYHWLFLFFSF